MSVNIFITCSEKKKINIPKKYNLIYLISGDESTEMSLSNYFRNGGVVGPEDIFVSLLHKTPLEFRIDNFLIPWQNLVITLPDYKQLPGILRSEEDSSDGMMDIVKSDDYDFWSGDRLDSDSKIVRKYVFKRMKELKKLTHVFIDAGYLEDSDYPPGKIDDHYITFENPLQKFFVTQCGPETSAPIDEGGDMTVEDEFLINPSFRKGITMYWMSVIANFMVNNDLVTIEEVGSIGDWEDPETWEELKDYNISE